MHRTWLSFCFVNTRSGKLSAKMDLYADALSSTSSQPIRVFFRLGVLSNEMLAGSEIFRRAMFLARKS